MTDLDREALDLMRRAALAALHTYEAKELRAMSRCGHGDPMRIYYGARIDHWRALGERIPILVEAMGR